MNGPTPGAVAGTTSTREVEGWWERAVCRTADRELFFAPDDERGNATKKRETEAKAVCAICPVKVQCLEDALKDGLEGVWGGTNDAERREIRKDREKAQEQAASSASVKARPKTRAKFVRKKPTQRAGCGTPSGGRNHYKHGEEACEACLAARREDDQQKRFDALVVQVRDLVGIGADIHQAARAVGRSAEALERALYRRDQHELVAQLNRVA